MRWAPGLALALALLACRDNPNIDGSKVQAGTATCSDVCKRIDALCGYAPPDCDDDVDGGYCQTSFDDTMLACMASAPSCQAAWECEPAPPADDDAGDEGGGDASDDGATE